MAVIRDTTDDQPRADLTGLTLAAAPAAHGHQELADRVVNRLYRVARGLQAAADLPHDTATRQIAGALQYLDDIIREIRDETFGGCDHDDPPAAPH